MLPHGLNPRWLSGFLPQGRRGDYRVGPPHQSHKINVQGGARRVDGERRKGRKAAAITAVGAGRLPNFEEL